MDLTQAFAGDMLSNENVAKTIQVRINPHGTNVFKTFDTFSRIGFVSGETNFLLESVPSIDKKPFYSLVKKAIEQTNTANKLDRMTISIDIFSGSGEIIETLIYKDCDVTDYFVHGVDSRGKIFFAPNDGEVEIREVTKFAGTAFTIEIDYTEEEIEEIIESLEPIYNPFEFSNDQYFSIPATNGTEGELFYNSQTNRLQKFVDGEWTDISGVGGPPSPRR